MTTTSHATSNNVYIQPGVLAAAMLGPVLIGLDADFVFMPAARGAGWPPSTPSGIYAALMLGGQLGVRL
jgi:hypothetical protein